MSDGQVVYEITGDMKNLTQALNDCTAAIQKAGKKWDDSVDESSERMRKSMNKAFDIERVKNFGISVGKYLVQFGQSAIAAASDLAEVQNVVDVTFGDGAAQIESWSKKAQSQFGLTEIQAKRFTSTMGAMMKSAGLTGPEIVNMSTDLAGLAADMASFYNMDFETAFSKIRSGIAGQTMPLKELGINMNVAALEAYALSKGIAKAYKDMSQGEQTMLRYQYLMQATADAQGDFARTADGYANAQRRIETALTSIETSAGKLLYGPFADATVIVANFLERLTAPKEKTVLDEIAEIDIQTEKKLKEIQAVSDRAKACVQLLENIGSDVNAGRALENIANGANILKASSPLTWSLLLNALQKVDGLQNIFSNSNAGKNVEDLANALSGNSPDTSKAEAWQTFLGALSKNTDALSALTGTSPEDTATWLSSIATAANELTPENAEGWNKLLSNFVGGLPGLRDTEAGKEFFENLALQFLAMGTESEEAKNGLLALGLSTDDITNRQKKWLETCKMLVQAIPSLNGYINTQTGEINGGVGALREYVKQWSEAQRVMAEIEALEAKRKIIKQYADTSEYEVKAELARIKYENKALEYGRARDYVPAETQANKSVAGPGRKAGTYEPGTVVTEWGEPVQGGKILTTDQYRELKQLYEEMQDAENALAKQKKANEAAEKLDEQYEKDLDALQHEYEDLTGSMKSFTGETAQASSEMTALQKAAEGDGDALKDVKTALTEAGDAMKALADYQEQVRKETESTVSQVISGFSKVVTPVQQAEAQMKDLTDQMNNLDTSTEEGQKQLKSLNAQINKLGGEKPSVQNMTEGLQSQLDYIQEYKKMLDQARQMGVSSEILAWLSDGSTESYDYLKALTTTGGDIEKLNEVYAQVQEESKAFTDELTRQKLTADETYKGLVSSADEAIRKLNQYDGAKASVEATVQGIVDGLADKASSVQEQVDSILAQIARLESASGYGANFGFGGMIFAGLNSILKFHSHETGLDYVPFDDYFAKLHEGESVLTAEESKVWRQFKYGQQSSRNSFDYGAMGSAVGANIPSMGNMQIIWRGRVVADVLSEQQADSLRALERSGWRS